MVFYGILDVLAKPVFCFIHLFLLSKLDLTALQLQSGKFSAAATGVAAYDREKYSGGSRHHNDTAPPPMVVENPPRTGGVSYSPKKSTFSSPRKSRRSNNTGDVVATTGTNNVMDTNVHAPSGPRASESTAVSHQTNSS